jgi:hypothetical protein
MEKYATINTSGLKHKCLQYPQIKSYVCYSELNRCETMTNDRSLVESYLVNQYLYTIYHENMFHNSNFSYLSLLLFSYNEVLNY